jgi:hypothetical protein
MVMPGGQKEKGAVVSGRLIMVVPNDLFGLVNAYYVHKWGFVHGRTMIDGHYCCYTRPGTVYDMGRPYLRQYEAKQLLRAFVALLRNDGAPQSFRRCLR